MKTRLLEILAALDQIATYEANSSYAVGLVAEATALVEQMDDEEG